MEIKKGGGLPFAKKEDYEYQGEQFDADIKDGDTIKILDSGVVEQGKFGEQKNFKVETRNGIKKLTINQPSENVLVAELGDDSEKWVGKEVSVLFKKDVIGGRKVLITYLIVGDWKLDEYGELVKEGGTEPVEKEADEVSLPE